MSLPRLGMELDFGDFGKEYAAGQPWWCSPGESLHDANLQKQVRLLHGAVTVHVPVQHAKGAFSLRVGYQGGAGTSPCRRCPV
jgi:hypothetical protein